MTDFLQYLEHLKQMTEDLGVTVVTEAESGVFNFSFYGCPKERFSEYDEVFTKVFACIFAYLSSEMKRNCCIEADEEALFVSILKETFMEHGANLIQRAMLSTKNLTNDIIAFSMFIRSQLELYRLGYQMEQQENKCCQSREQATDKCCKKTA